MSAANFASEMNTQQFGHKDQMGADMRAKKLGGQKTGIRAYSFPDGSAATYVEEPYNCRWQAYGSIAELAKGGEK